MNLTQFFILFLIRNGGFMKNDKKLENLRNHVFNNTWEEFYRKSFQSEEIEKVISANNIMQIIVWCHKHNNFYPSYPLYAPSKQNKNLKDYQEYIKGNYTLFSFAKFIQKNNITKEIRLLLHSKKSIKEDNKSVTIPISDSLTDEYIEGLSLTINKIFKVDGSPTKRELTIYFEKLYKLLDKFNFKTIILQPLLNKNRVIGVLSIYSETPDYTESTLEELRLSVSDKIINLRKLITKAEREKKKREDEEQEILIRNVISSIMSRNISHNIGSHVLVNVENQMENTPIIEHKRLINYILERMNFITQVSTLWSPEWSLPRFFKKEIIQQFLDQKHLLYNIVTIDGLKYKEKSDKSYYIISKETPSKTKHSFQIINRDRPISKTPITEENDDVLVDIPGGKIGYHAIYTIIENILRNSAKYGYATLSNRYQKKRMELNITIEENKNSHQHRVQIWDNVSYISNLLHAFNPPIKELRTDEIKLINIKELTDEPFIKIELQIKEERISIYVHKTLERIKDNSWTIAPSSNFNYEEKLKDKESFFISQARFHSILKNLGDKDNNSRFIYTRAQNILTKKENLLKFIILLQKRVFNPLHKSINLFFNKSIIDNEKDLNKNNGLSEIKICALYLSGSDYHSLAKNKKRSFIQAIAKPDYDEAGHLLCYRLGYEFLLNKPTIYSLCLSPNFKEKLSFIQECSDESFVLLKESPQKSSLRTSPKIISSEFLIYDFKKFEESILKLNKEDMQDKLNRFPYRIIVLTDGISNRLMQYTQPFIRKRVAQLDISECHNKENFKEKILNTWREHTLKVNRHNQIDIEINLNGSYNNKNMDNMIPIAENLLQKFTDKLLENEFINNSQKNKLLKIIQYESKSILHNTDFQKLFRLDEENKPKINHHQTLNQSSFSFKLKEYDSDFNHKTILLSRHLKDKEQAKATINIEAPLVYYESLSGETNQFWMYQYMFKEENNPTNLLFNQIKLLETALYRIAIFDERLLSMIDSQQAENQNLYFINEINGYKISNFSNGLSGEFQNLELLLKQKSDNPIKKVNIDILIVHYGLLEKIRENSKLSAENLKILLSSFPMVVLTSGRGIILNNKTTKRGHIKFISFPILKEYFRHNAINKLGLTQMLMNLIGIKNNLSGLYYE